MRYLLSLFVVLSAFATDSNPPRWKVDSGNLVLMSQVEVDGLTDPSWRMQDGKVVVMTQAEIDAAAPSLDEVKATKIAAIKTRTAELTKSFTHNTATYDLTVVNQLHWKALADAVDNDTVAVPVTVTAQSDSEVTLSTKADVAAWYNAGVGHILSVITGQKTLISSVKAAT